MDRRAIVATALSALRSRGPRRVRCACLGGLGLILVTLSAFAGRSQYQRPAVPEIAPPENPGDKFSEWFSTGREVSCPDGMKCGGARYQKRKLVEPARCQLESGRCAVSSDCLPNQTCILNTLAIGYCAPSPGLVWYPRPDAGGG
jgi:hypothetical protein